MGLARNFFHPEAARRWIQCRLKVSSPIERVSGARLSSIGRGGSSNGRASIGQRARHAADRVITTTTTKGLLFECDSPISNCQMPFAAWLKRNLNAIHHSQEVVCPSVNRKKLVRVPSPVSKLAKKGRAVQKQCESLKCRKRSDRSTDRLSNLPHPNASINTSGYDRVVYSWKLAAYSKQQIDLLFEVVLGKQSLHNNSARYMMPDTRCPHVPRPIHDARCALEEGNLPLGGTVVLDIPRLGNQSNRAKSTIHLCCIY